MADTIGIILEYLHQHHFSKAEAVLREEVTARQQANGPLPLPLNDALDLDVTIYLKLMQEKAAGQQHLLNVKNAKPSLDVEKKSSSEMKLSAQLLRQGQEAEDKLHSQVDKLWPLTKLEEPEPLFMEFEVEELEHPATTLQRVGNSVSPPDIHSPVPEKALVDTTLPVVLSPVSEKTLSDTKNAPARVGGLAVLQTVAEVAASSSLENISSDHKVQPSSVNTGKYTEVTVELFKSPASVEKERSSTQDVDSTQSLLEATRSKVGALKQRWEPKPADKPVVPEKGRAVGAKKVDGHTNVQDNSNGLLTPVQASAKGSAHLGSGGEIDLTSHEKNGVLAILSNNVTVRERSPEGITFTVPSSPDWTNVPVKTIAPIKTTESIKRSEEGAVEVSSLLLEEMRKTTGQSNKDFQEVVLQVPCNEEIGAQNGQVLPEECNKNPVGLMQNEETASQLLDSNSRLVPLNSCEEELPKLPPVRLRSNDSKTPEIPQDGFSSGVRKTAEALAPINVTGAVEATPLGLGAYLDIPVGQDISSSGPRRINTTARLSVSHGIVEDQPELLSRFATTGDGQSESAVDFPDEYWDSDTYEDDEDPGYHRQPVEDEEWFLAHEIDYPSDDERARPSVENSRGVHQEKDYEKFEDEDHSFVEEQQSYFSGEEYYRSKAGEDGVETQVEVDKVRNNDLFVRMDGGGNFGPHSQVSNATRILDQGEYERQLLNMEGLTMMGGDTRWQGFDATKRNGSKEGGSEKGTQGRSPPDSSFDMEDERVGSVRFGRMGVSSDVAEFGSDRRESLLGESSECDLEISEIGIRSIGQPSSSSQVANSDSGKVLEPEFVGNQDEEEEEEDIILKYYNNPWASHKRRGVERETSSLDSLHLQNREIGKCSIPKLGDNGDVESHSHKDMDIGSGAGFGGFSFPSPSTSGGDIATVSRVDSGKSLWSVRDITGQVVGEEGEDYGNGVVGPDDPLASWRRKSNESSPIISPRNEALRDLALSVRSTGSANSTDGYGSGAVKDDDKEEDDAVEEEVEEEDLLEVDQHIREAEAVAAEDEEAAAVQEQIRRIKAEEDEFETFDLKIVHRKNRTGFEEDKDFPVIINAVIAGRYHVTEYLGSAAFSKAIQAHDLHTGMDVCMKIIKNNKDFFDQSLDEIKLLKYINKHDPSDKHHVLRLYDYFYHREHLFIVCELLRANLYEFHKYNRESGGEVYFTMPRLQSITRQCLEALEFIHGLGLIHCDLKPENILVKSYSRCEVKVIDLGSSCFQTDHLCSYVQSRSYRAPEVILGLPYDQKIDMWSLGCILAELCSGNVLFQNDSLATLLARVVGILGPIDPELLAKGRDTHKFFTKNHMLYERNQDSEQLEYLLPKKTSLAHRLPMGDSGFVEFVGYLLQINPSTRPSASEALKHPWLSFPYEPISS